MTKRELKTVAEKTLYSLVMDKPGLEILSEDENCWRIANADRAAILIDCAGYFGALRKSLLEARRSVFIVGWDIDSRTRLVGPSGDADDGFPDRLGPFLTELVTRRPALKIHLLLWDYSMLYALEREPLPSVNLAWKTPEQISVCLDDVLPVGASHHQKIVVIDDAIAFSGGLDLTIRRWDTPEHEMTSDRRVDPFDERYRPFHDIQMVVDGDAARALGELVRGRWRDSACETPMELKTVGDPWPEHVHVDFTDVRVGIARTLPAYNGSPEVREVEALYRRSIEAAEKSIYIESQYLTAHSVARCLAQRMRENEGLEVLIVAPNVHHSWLEERSMNTGRLRFVQLLEEAGVKERVRLLYPALPDDDTGEGVMVHSKFMIVDDRFLRVGSANLNNRSMGLDTECDLALDAANEDHRKKITEIRNRLLAEHLGLEPDAVMAAIEEHGSFLAAVDDLSAGERALHPIDLSDVPEDEMARTVGQVADPERPIATPTFVGDLFGGTPGRGGDARLVKLVAVVAAVLGMVALWRLTPLSDIIKPEELVHWITELSQDFWMQSVIPVVFIIGGLVAFPVTVLIAVIGMMFSPLIAVTYSVSGALLSALVTFCIGHAIGRGPMRQVVGPKVNRISRTLARKGILSVATLRMLPVAPFTLINLAAGASHIRLMDFFFGTLLGMAPGILVMSLLGHQLGETLSNPEPMELFLLGLGLAGWLILSVGLQYLASRFRSGRNE